MTWKNKIIPGFIGKAMRTAQEEANSQPKVEIISNHVHTDEAPLIEELPHGLTTDAEWLAYEKGSADREIITYQWIEQWEGSTNSAMGELLNRKFNELMNEKQMDNMNINESREEITGSMNVPNMENINNLTPIAKVLSGRNQHELESALNTFLESKIGIDIIKTDFVSSPGGLYYTILYTQPLKRV